MRPEEIDGGFHNSLLEETPHLGTSQFHGKDQAIYHASDLRANQASACICS